MFNHPTLPIRLIGANGKPAVRSGTSPRGLFGGSLGWGNPDRRLLLASFLLDRNTNLLRTVKSESKATSIPCASANCAYAPFVSPRRSRFLLPLRGSRFGTVSPFTTLACAHSPCLCAQEAQRPQSSRIERRRELARSTTDARPPPRIFVAQELSLFTLDVKRLPRRERSGRHKSWEVLNGQTRWPHIAIHYNPSQLAPFGKESGSVERVASHR